MNFNVNVFLLGIFAAVFVAIGFQGTPWQWGAPAIVMLVTIVAAILKPMKPPKKKSKPETGSRTAS